MNKPGSHHPNNEQGTGEQNGREQALEQQLAQLQVALAQANQKIVELEAGQVERSSELHLRFALEFGQIATWDWDISTGKMVWNDYAFRLLGYEPGAFVPDYEHWLAAIHPEEQWAVDQAVGKSIAEKYDFFAEYRVIWPDGSQHWIVDRGRGIYDSQGQIIRAIGIMQDITQQKQTEVAFRKLLEDTVSVVDEDFFAHLGQSLVETLGIAHAIITELQEDELRTLTFWSNGNLVPNMNYWLTDATACRMVIEQGEYLCLANVKEVHPHNPYLKALEAESYIGIALRNQASQVIGHLCIIDTKPITNPDFVHSILKIFAVQAAVELERQRAKAAQQQLREQLEQRVEDRTQALARSEKDLRTILNNVHDALFIHDLDGQILDINARAVELYGTTHSQLLTATIADLSAPDAPLEEIPQILDQISHGKLLKFEWKSQKPNGGAIFDAEISLQKVILGDRSVFIAGVRDITERKRLEHQLRQMNAELEQRVVNRTVELTQAMEAANAANRAKSIFLANMSHELRTPLNAILGFSQLLCRHIRLPAEQQQQIDIINRSGEHLLHLINDILEMSKIEAGRVVLAPENFNLLTLLADLEVVFRLKANSKGLQFLLHLDPAIPLYLQADVAKLRQILTNLLSNAVKFTQTGSVTLKISLGSPATAPHPSQLNPSQPLHWQNLCFEVVDTGPGIAPSDYEALFEPFVQTQTGQQAQEGTGLGLPISRQFALMMGGELSVQSRLNHGSAFFCTLPVAIVDAVDLPTQTPQLQVVGLAPNQPTYRLLVAEDHPDSRQFLVQLLQSIGFEVRAACNGQEAIVLWQEWSPHLIWMDMRMPVLDGYAATRQIRALTQAGQPTTKILALTASIFADEQAAIFEVGCNDLVCKPVTEKILLEKLAEHIGVCYIYAEQKTPNAPVMIPAESSVIQMSEWFATVLPLMPTNWLERLQRAARIADEELIFDLLQQLPPSHSTLAQALQQLVREFQLETLIELTTPAS